MAVTSPPALWPIPKHVAKLREFPCDAVDTRLLNRSECAFAASHRGQSPCTFVPPAADWRSAPLIATQRTIDAWRHTYRHDLWLQQCLPNATSEQLLTRYIARGSQRMFERIPETVGDKPYGTCAVVGNSYALRGQRFGEEIDRLVRVRVCV
jgi:hypothetical protein